MRSSVCLFICVVVMMLNVNVHLTDVVCVSVCAMLFSSWIDRVYTRDYHHGTLSVVGAAVWHTV